jgi:hypothetical protein
VTGHDLPIDRTGGLSSSIGGAAVVADRATGRQLTAGTAFFGLRAKCPLRGPPGCTDGAVTVGAAAGVTAAEAVTGAAGATGVDVAAGAATGEVVSAFMAWED